ncbi:MAG: GHKL domain-containing protein [Lachnospiraceae bacterium]|nr:GHKL domain-containing protein [Lachnospiraceae bacterium]
MGVALLFVWNAWESYISNLVVLFGNILWAFSYTLFFKCSFSTVYIWENFYSVMVSLLKMPVLILIGLLQNKILTQVNREIRNFTEVIWCLGIEILIIILIKKKKDIIKLLRMLLCRYKKLLVIIFAIEWSMLTYSMYLGEWGFAFIDFVLHLIFILCAVLLMLYLMLNILYREIKSENIILDTIQNNLQNQNEKLQSFYNQKNQQIHDVKHVMIYLRNCLESGKTEEALAQVCDFTNDLTKMERKVWTGFPCLDFVLNCKKVEMDENKIKFELEVDLYQIPIKDAELGVVLGNLFDNAIEAAKKCELSKRKVFLRICNPNEMFILSLYNSSTQTPMMVDDRFITSKEDKYAHGLGVESVKRIVEKYNGNISFQYDDEHFEVDILI